MYDNAVKFLVANANCPVLFMDVFENIRICSCHLMVLEVMASQ